MPKKVSLSGQALGTLYAQLTVLTAEHGAVETISLEELDSDKTDYTEAYGPVPCEGVRVGAVWSVMRRR